MRSAEVVELERLEAEAQRHLVSVLARQDPSWGSTTFGVADGWAVLAGPGLFVNQVMAAGLTEPITHDDIDVVVDRATQVGVTPAFEFCDATRTDAVTALRERSWLPNDNQIVMAHGLGSIPEAIPGIDIAFIGEAELPIWQLSSAVGWGLTSAAAQAANDAFSAAAFETDRPGLLLARDSLDGRPLACATLRISHGVAVLGGMSTRPEERRRGAHAALISWRLRYAEEHDCRYAISLARRGGDSARNLLRFGFTPAYTKTVWQMIETGA